MGRAFVQQIMDKYRRLDEIWVIARHLQKEMWKERFGTKIVLLSAGSFAGSSRRSG